MELPLPTSKLYLDQTPQLEQSSQQPQLDVWYRHRYEQAKVEQQNNFDLFSDLAPQWWN